MHIAIASNSKLVTTGDLAAIAVAVQRQLQRHFCPAWGLAVPQVQAAADPKTVPAGAQVVLLMDQPDEPDALGWHTESAGRFFAHVFCRPVLDAGGVELYDAKNPRATSIASVVSHEALEMVGNPGVNRWVDGPRIKQGSEFSLEVCDPVEGDAYVIDAGSAGRPVPVSVSNFVFPEWFDPQTPAGARVDQLGKAKGPFRMSAGGYMIVRSGPGRENAVYGRRRPEWRRSSTDRGSLVVAASRRGAV